MKNIKIASAAILLSALSFGVFAAEPVAQPASSTNTTLVFLARTTLKRALIWRQALSLPASQWMMPLMYIPWLPVVGPNISVL